MNTGIELLINGTEAIQWHHCGMAREAIDDAPTSEEVTVQKVWTVEEAEVFLLADRLKAWYDTMIDGIQGPEEPDGVRVQDFNRELEFRESLIQQLIAHAYADINFQDLARAVLKKYRDLKAMGILI